MMNEAHTGKSVDMRAGYACARVMHPEPANVAVFANLQTAIGLPAALKVAGIHIPIAGGSPLPQNLQDMKNGYITEAFAFGFGAIAYTQMDAAARVATNEPHTRYEKEGLAQDQLITKANLGGGQGNAGGSPPTVDFAKSTGSARSQLHDE